jgi:nucleoside-diphosphate-sugar epimerase
MDDMNAPKIDVVPVIGYGPIGRETTRLLLEKGYHVRVVQRREPEDLPDGASFTKADAMDSAQLSRAIEGARTIVFALGLPYDGKVWAEGWPKAMKAVLTACEHVGARMVYADSLYLYGPQDQPLTETLPAVDYGLKPTARSAATRLWQQAFADGRVKTAAVRAPDFFGPGVSTSVLGAATLGRMAQGKAAQILISADHPHDIVHIADFARAIVTLVEAPDDAYGQAWHVPTPPTKTLRETLTIAAKAMGVPVRVSVISSGFGKILDLFMQQVREAMELHYLFDRPYFVDSRKFREYFWSDVEPLERSVAATARSYLAGKF